MKAMAKWLLMMTGLLALLTAVRLASAAEVADQGERSRRAAAGVSDVVHKILASLSGVDRGEAIRDAVDPRAGDEGDGDSKTPPDRNRGGEGPGLVEKSPEK